MSGLGDGRRYVWSSFRQKTFAPWMMPCRLDRALGEAGSLGEQERGLEGQALRSHIPPEMSSVDSIRLDGFQHVVRNDSSEQVGGQVLLFTPRRALRVRCFRSRRGRGSGLVAPGKAWGGRMRGVEIFSLGSTSPAPPYKGGVGMGSGGQVVTLELYGPIV